MIEIKNLKKSFDDKVVLNDLNLSIPTGSVFGLIGENGCGKTTLLTLLNGVLLPDEGEVLIDGISVENNPDVKRKILLISDDPYYHHNETVDSLFTFYQTWYPNLDKDIYYHYIDLFELPKNKTIKNFSKGMKRQTLLAVAIAISPQYLLLDEAFDGLDPLKRLEFKKIIASCIEEKEMTIIISSHNLRELEDICDCYGIISEGKVLQSGYLNESKENIHKVQLAFSSPVSQDDFKDFNLMYFKMSGKVVNIVVKGDIHMISEHLKQLNPVMLEVLPVNLEEIFIYEMEGSEKHV